MPGEVLPVTFQCPAEKQIHNIDVGSNVYPEKGHGMLSSEVVHYPLDRSPVRFPPSLAIDVPCFRRYSWPNGENNLMDKMDFSVHIPIELDKACCLEHYRW